MYVIYPLICLAAGVALVVVDDAAQWCVAAAGKKPLGWLAGAFTAILPVVRGLLLVGVVALSVARSLSMVIPRPMRALDRSASTFLTVGLGVYICCVCIELCCLGSTLPPVTR